jgi:hypothetical protein
MTFVDYGGGGEGFATSQPLISTISNAENVAPSARERNPSYYCALGIGQLPIPKSIPNNLQNSTKVVVLNLYQG